MNCKKITKSFHKNKNIQCELEWPLRSYFIKLILFLIKLLLLLRLHKVSIHGIFFFIIECNWKNWSKSQSQVVTHSRSFMRCRITYVFNKIICAQFTQEEYVDSDEFWFSLEIFLRVLHSWYKISAGVCSTSTSGFDIGFWLLFNVFSQRKGITYLRIYQYWIFHHIEI